MGQSARLCYEALKQNGLPVYGIDVSARLRQTEDMPDYAFVDGRHLNGPATLILHVNAPLMPLALAGFSRAFMAHKRVVGYWAWELPDAPDDWRYGTPLVHDIWATSRFTADALHTIASGKAVNVLHHPVAITEWPTASTHAPLEAGPLRCLMIFNAASSFERKNPLAAITAFQKAFANPSEAQLTIKALNLHLCPEQTAMLRAMIASSPNITLIEEVMDQAALNALYQRHDVLLSLHRSEGFGLPIVEAMLAGKVVLATNWSGNCDFLNAENGCPVPYTLIPARDPQNTYEFPSMLWADPDTDAAAGLLQNLYRAPQWRLDLGRKAALDARKAFGAHHYAESVMELLKLSPPAPSSHNRKS